MSLLVTQATRRTLPLVVAIEPRQDNQHQHGYGRQDDRSDQLENVHRTLPVEGTP